MRVWRVVLLLAAITAVIVAMTKHFDQRDDLNRNGDEPPDDSARLDHPAPAQLDITGESIGLDDAAGEENLDSGQLSLVDEEDQPASLVATPADDESVSRIQATVIICA